MRKVALRTILFLLLASVASGAVIEGVITDFESGEPVPFATIRVPGTGKSMAANADGRYRLRLSPGRYELKFSHIAHYSETIEVTIAAGVENLERDIKLRPSIQIIKGVKAYTRAYDPGQRIILEAIARKEEILKRLKSYSFDAYSKLVVRNAKKDTNNIWIITETQLQGFWEQPDKYSEVITSRRQSSNMNPDDNLVTIGQILDFNRNRIDLGPMAVVSPTADDALKHYNYYLLDTLYMDNKPVFRLEVEPKNEYEPLFSGTIDIADSSYAVVGVDFGFSKGFGQNMIEEPRYIQRGAEFDENIWMPIEIRFSGIFDIELPLIPRISFDYVAALHNYDLNIGHPEGRFDYAIEVLREADDFDSTAWAAMPSIPLTLEEVDGYSRIDSTENAPRSFWKTALYAGGFVLFNILGNYDAFHYNRVDGFYGGLGLGFRDVAPNLDLYAKTGYAFAREEWQHLYAATYHIPSLRQMAVSGQYHKVTEARMPIRGNGQEYGMMAAIFDYDDANDYFLQEGHAFSLSFKPLRKISLRGIYRNYLQSSVPIADPGKLIEKTDEIPINPAIANGRLRSLSGEIVYDSRPLMKYKGREYELGSFARTIIKAGIENADPDYINTDFHFKKYYLSLNARRPLSGLGYTSLFLYGGASDHILPPQKFFTINHMSWIEGLELTFKTLDDNNFVGDRVASGYLFHNFGNRPFRATGIPLVRDIPFSLGVYGGMFVAEFKNTSLPADFDHHRTADKAYSEIGFSIGAIPPLGFDLYFTWQLSDYGTKKFSFDLGFGLFD